jgi:hypothetical protein
MNSKGGNRPKKKTPSNEGQLYVSNLPDNAERSKFSLKRFFEGLTIFRKT